MQNAVTWTKEVVRHYDWTPQCKMLDNGEPLPRIPVI